MAKPHPYQVLALEMGRNDADAATVGDYLIALLAKVWQEGEEFNGKRPFGNSGWEYELYLPLVRAGYVVGTIVDDELDDCDIETARELIANAIEALRPDGETHPDDYDRPAAEPPGYSGGIAELGYEGDG